MKISLEAGTIFFARSQNSRSSLYASLLSSEIEKRIYLRLPCNEIEVSQADFSSPGIYLIVKREDPILVSCSSNEAYVISTRNKAVLVESVSERGLLFGLGRLLRELEMKIEQEYEIPLKQHLSLDAETFIVSNPKFKWRGHQIAYRPKTNTYDAFTVNQMQQEILDCTLWGANTIEIIPPGLDDYQQSPHFQTSWLNMIGEVSAYCDKLDIDVSMWYPAFFVDYSQAETMEKAVAHWSSIFANLKRLDKLFVPGGDPGGRDPVLFLEIVGKQAEFMRKNYFPKAEVWVSSQFGLAISSDLQLAPWNPKEYENRFYKALSGCISWLNGVVYGPWTADPIDVFRKNVPINYPVRNYPDLCHSLKCEFPIQYWDKTYAMTHSREGINPRPRAYSRIIKDQSPLTDGCGCYSEGVNDDLNKVVWSAFHWGLDEKGNLTDESKFLDNILEQYGRVYIKGEVAALVKDLAFLLEQNWTEDPLDGEMIGKVFGLCNKIELSVSSRDQRNWRLQLLLFRAYYDIFLGSRRKEEARLENHIREFLEKNIEKEPIDKLLDQALAIAKTKSWENLGVYNSYINNQWPGKPFLPSNKNQEDLPNLLLLLNRLNMLAGALYQGIGIQVSVIWHGNVHTERGAPFDLAWLPLSDLPFLMHSIGEIQAIADKGQGKERLRNYLNAENRGSYLWRYSFGEFSKENRESEPYLVLSNKLVPLSLSRSIGEDPTYFYTPILDYADTNSLIILANIAKGVFRRSWLGWITSIWPTCSEIVLLLPVGKIKDYTEKKGLILEVTYVGKDLWMEGGDWIEFNRTVEPTRLLINGKEVHGFYDMQEVTKRHEFAISVDVVKQGKLELRFEPQNADNITIRTPILPVAELRIKETNINFGKEC